MKRGYASTALNLLRTLLIVAMLFGWLVLSQRCALGQMLKIGQALQHECCEKGGSQPARTPTDRPAECCHALTVLVPDGSRVPDVSISYSLLPPVSWIVAALDLRPVKTVFAAKADPPSELFAFTELVLHRSLRSHAPPVLA